jgi:hypothetical protein
VAVIRYEEVRHDTRLRSIGRSRRNGLAYLVVFWEAATQAA